ncbi:MAG TPA: hypothetical protein VJZ94_03120, partial [Candidatus Paceibacterota bacterium]|nr:hypothetical protein [Candidatus Paceibacterota bacterium]
NPGLSNEAQHAFGGLRALAAVFAFAVNRLHAESALPVVQRVRFGKGYRVASAVSKKGQMQ